MKRWVLLFLIIYSMPGCKNAKDETGDDALYFDYKITGEEGNDNLSVLLQFRAGGIEGDAVSVGGHVMLDEESITADSTRMSGVFYETYKPIDPFAGKHTILFTGNDNKEYREDFGFQPVKLLTVINDTVERGEMVFNLSGFKEEDRVRVLLTDTSFANNGLNEIFRVKNGQLVIREDNFTDLADGPVQLTLTREDVQPVKNGTMAGGRLMVTYTLKREFYLHDRPGMLADSATIKDLHK